MSGGKFVSMLWVPGDELRGSTIRALDAEGTIWVSPAFGPAQFSVWHEGPCLREQGGRIVAAPETLTPVDECGKPLEEPLGAEGTI